MDQNNLERFIADCLVPHEGEVLHAYQDSKGYWTIGIGTLIDERLGGGITQAESRYLCMNRVSLCLADLQTFPWWSRLDGPRQEAILEMRYVLGYGRFRLFRHMLAALDTGNYVKAAAEILDSKFCSDVKPHRCRAIADKLRTGKD